VAKATLSSFQIQTAARPFGKPEMGIEVGRTCQTYSSVVSLKRLNNKATRVIPAKAGIQKVRTVDSVSSTE